MGKLLAAPANGSRNPSSSSVIKLSANVPMEAFEALKQIKEERGSTLTDALKTAIGTEQWVRETLRRGARILVEEPNGEVHIVVFR